MRHDASIDKHTSSSPLPIRALIQKIIPWGGLEWVRGRPGAHTQRVPGRPEPPPKDTLSMHGSVISHDEGQSLPGGLAKPTDDQPVRIVDHHAQAIVRNAA